MMQTKRDKVANSTSEQTIFWKPCINDRQSLTWLEDLLSVERTIALNTTTIVQMTLLQPKDICNKRFVLKTFIKPYIKKSAFLSSLKLNLNLFLNLFSIIIYK